MQLSEFREHIRARVDDARGLLADDKTLDLWFNLAVRRVWRYFPWPFTRVNTTVVTVSGTATVDLPADCSVPTKVVNETTDTILVPKPERWLRDVYKAADRGEPYYYTEGGLSQPAQTSPPVRRLRLFPTPGSVYTLRVVYKATPPKVDAGGEYSPLPEDFDEAIIQWVLVRFFRKVDDFQAAAEAAAELTTEMQNLIEMYAASQHEHFPRIPLTEWHD